MRSGFFNLHSMKIEVSKIAESADSTLSIMVIDSKYFCFVIEDGHRDVKVPGETRIPEGIYQVVRRTVGGFFNKYRSRYNHKFAIQLADVPGFQDILIHMGNTKADTRGCLLVAYGANYVAPNYEGVNSTGAYLELYNRVAAAFDAGETVTVEVRRGQ